MLAVSAVSLAVNNAIAADAYELIDLGELDKATSFAYGINNAGEVVGYSTISVDGEDSLHAFKYLSGSMTDSGAIVNEDPSEAFVLNAKDFSIAFAINDIGASAGLSKEIVSRDKLDDNDEVVLDSNGDPVIEYLSAERATIFQNDGTIVKIPFFEDATERQLSSGSSAAAINNDGIVVGSAFYDRPDDVDGNGNSTSVYMKHAFIYDSSNELLTAILPENTAVAVTSSFRDINNTGVAVGWHSTENSTSDTRAVYYDSTISDNLVNLEVYGSEDEIAIATAINDSNVVVGRAYRPDEGHFTAYTHDINTGETNSLGFLNTTSVNGQESEAYDINNSGQVVGRSIYSIYPNVYHAFVYDNGEIKDINDLIDCVQEGNEPVGERDWEIVEARSINDEGVIVGSGIFSRYVNGEPVAELRAVMLRPKEGEVPVACPVIDDEDESGGGSIPFISLLLFPLLTTFRKKS
nr:DUF3466 family protein [Aliikangiella sp. G2MR2-5]